MSAAEQTDPTYYPTFNAFFTRALKPEYRPIIASEKTIACPVDGFVSQSGMLEQDCILQAKGIDYSLVTLLGGMPERARPFLNGHFATLYLAPKNYHRIHMPITGTLQEMIHIPGQLFSVNTLSVAGVPNLFARNERVVAIFKTEIGLMAMVLVGAMIVASIETVWAGLVRASADRKIQIWQYQDRNIILAKGAEMGRFLLGSTVILLFPPGKINWAPALMPESTVVMGQYFGDIKKEIDK